jgi:hypothetical protein
MLRHLVLGIWAFGLSTAALAQAPRALLDCTSILSDAERLSCYDTAVKTFSADARAIAERREAQAARLAAAAAATAAAQKADSFGRASEARVESVDSTLKEVLTDSVGKSVFILENGQIWRQADGFRMPNARPGVAVTVKRGAMGSYRLAVAGSNRTVQVIRMR